MSMIIFDYNVKVMKCIGVVVKLMLRRKLEISVIMVRCVWFCVRVEISSNGSIGVRNCVMCNV